MYSSFDPANAELFLAPYLTSERKEGFLKELKQFPPKRIYTTINDPDPLQGDGWVGCTVVRFEDGKRDQIKGVVVTNSCDVAGDNKRATPVNLSFAPILLLHKYHDLIEKGLGKQAADDHVREVREQKISSIFYLPDTGDLGGESIVLLDVVHTIPLSAFQKEERKARLFSLSDVGFWLFLFKLSFHFCRFHENVDRSPSQQQGAVG
ncbi:hypothetical protein JJB11_22135 [Ramlibacter ginsenosidimutans]|uniref:Uncharacterized protein n=1 Tax=Ramlibacter ginsenosidimutans TaxID=502333 RepID=A0A934TWS3_9BURK|nr:hypothetical protein [Ramlibacter ginsenosidimutans]MBK6008805.1 hypothetical protein [Ramlibacter ginsenosidimutans]